MTEAVTMHPVKSSYLLGVGQDGDSLVVQFKDKGKTFRYAGGGHHFEAMMKADSVGKYFHAHIKGAFLAHEVK